MKSKSKSKRGGRKSSSLNDSIGVKMRSGSDVGALDQLIIGFLTTDQPLDAWWSATVCSPVAVKTEPLLLALHRCRHAGIENCF